VDGALLRAAQEILGSELATAIHAELAPVVELASAQEVSEIRPSRPVRAPAGAGGEDRLPEPTLEAPMEDQLRTVERRLVTDPAPGSLPLLLVATVDPSTLQELNRALVGVASLEPVTDALAILESLGEDDVVVVDCRRPSVRLETLLALGPELPDGARVVLWREDANVKRQLSALGSGMPGDWICCGPDAAAEDVATVCRVLFE